MILLRKTALIFITGLTLIGCSSTAKNHNTEESLSSNTKVETASSSPQSDVWGWDYEGERGPEHWSKLNPQYATCSAGTAQSPINLVWQKPSSPNPLKLNYVDSGVVATNAGYTYRMELTPESTLRFGEMDYVLEKIEFRSPSEHQLSGNIMPMEIQFYHRSSNGLKQAILSVFVVSGKGSAWFDTILAQMQGLPRFQSIDIGRFNPNQLIPPRQTFYHYEGSITHPPCLEGTQWFVFNTPLQLSQEQILAFRGLFPANNRPIQSTNGRKIFNY